MLALRRFCSSLPAYLPASRGVFRSFSTTTTTRTRMAKFVDTHTHLDYILRKNDLQVTDYPAFKEKNFPPEFDGCVSVCCDLESFDPTRHLMNNHNEVFAAFSLHPHNAKEYTDKIHEEILELMKHPKTVAWGEMGLDFHYNMSPPDVQREVFVRQLKAGVSVGKPIVIHTREAEPDTLQILREHLPRDWKVHIHCFTGTPAFARTILEEFPNSFIGITGVVTFKTAEDVRTTVSETPLNRLLLETDGPFMAPIPFRGKVAHPGYIPYVAQKIAEVKGVSPEEVIKATRENAHRMYGI